MANPIKGFLKDEDKKVVASNFLSLLLLQGANYILPLIIIPYMVRVLGTDKFGLIMFAQSLSLFLTVFVDFGFNLSGTREISIARHDKTRCSQIFMAIMCIKLVLTIMGFVILWSIVTMFTRFSVDSSVYLLSFGVVIGQALFPVWFFQGIEKMRFVTLTNILAKTIFTLLVFVLIKEESDYIYVPIYNSIGFIVAGLLGLLLCFKYIKFTKPSYSLIKHLFLESFSLFVANFASSLYTASNVFILGLFTSNAMVGVYSSMEKLIIAVKNIYIPLYQALFPWIARQEEAKKANIIKKLMPIVFLIGLIIAIIILIFSDGILHIIYNNELISRYSIVFKILSFIALFSGMNMLYNMLFFPSIKKYKVRMNILIAGGLFNVIMAFFFVQWYKIYATAVIVLTTELLLLLIGYYYYKKLSKQII